MNLYLVSFFNTVLYDSAKTHVLASSENEALVALKAKYKGIMRPDSASAKLVQENIIVPCVLDIK